MTEPARYRLVGGQYVPMNPDDGSGPPPLEDVTPYVRPGDLTPYVQRDELDTYVTEDDLEPLATDLDLGQYMPLSQFNDQAAAVATTVFGQLSASLARRLPKMRRWWAAVAGREVAPAQALVIGDSITEGVGTTLLVRRATVLLQRRLAAALDLPAGPPLPFVPGEWGFSGYGGAPGVNTGSVTSLGEAGPGLGQRALRLNTGGSRSVTVRATQLRVMLRKSATGGIASITIDGGAAVLVDTYQANGESTTTWTSPTLAAGNHTIVVARAGTTVAGRNVDYEGVQVFDGDTASGVRIIEAGRSGYRAQQYAANTKWAQAIPGLGTVSLLMLTLGSNDWGAGRTADQFRADTLAIIAAARANGFAGSVLLVGMWKAGGRDENSWAAYMNTLRSIADNDPDTSFLSVRDFFPTVADPNPTTDPNNLGMFTDFIHPNDIGNGFLADVYAPALMP